MDWPDADLGREVDDAVDSLHCLGDGVAVANVGADQFHLLRKILRPLAIPMDLLDQAIEHSNLMPPAQQFPANGTPDEAGAAGDQNLFWQCGPHL
jgi:hypothetical protein